MDIAIIGAGISGIGAAQALDPEHKITIFESKDSIGGHSNTIQVNELNIDTGFIVYNNRNYPGFSSFLKELCVKSSRTSMSFSYSDNDLNIEYAGSKKGKSRKVDEFEDQLHKVACFFFSDFYPNFGKIKPWKTNGNQCNLCGRI